MIAVLVGIYIAVTLFALAFFLALAELGARSEERDPQIGQRPTSPAKAHRKPLRSFTAKNGPIPPK